jgi:hypothetical protein
LGTLCLDGGASPDPESRVAAVLEDVGRSAALFWSLRWLPHLARVECVYRLGGFASVYPAAPPTSPAVGAIFFPAPASRRGAEFPVHCFRELVPVTEAVPGFRDAAVTRQRVNWCEIPCPYQQGIEAWATGALGSTPTQGRIAARFRQPTLDRPRCRSGLSSPPPPGAGERAPGLRPRCGALMLPDPRKRPKLALQKTQNLTDNQILSQSCRRLRSYPEE